MTQAEQVLAHLKSGKTITHLGAIRVYGIARLAARICDLKRQGHPITRRLLTHPKTGAHYAEYRMGRG